MTKPPGEDGRMPDALWDPAAPADPEVRRIEDALAPLRFDPAAAPLRIESKAVPRSPGPRTLPSRRIVRAAGLVAVAAVLLLPLVAAFHWSWPEGRPWPMTVLAEGTPPREEMLEVGRERRLGPGERARVEVARIGTLDLAPGTALTLRATASNAHRLVLSQGTLRARVWAPPGSVVVKTPAGDLIDLGCVFRLHVDGAGAARVSVESGWVQLENVHGESLVPAGASSAMRRDAAPLVPVFDDAPREVREGVRRLEAGGSANGAVEFVGVARPRDAVTLLALARRIPPGIRRAVLERAAVLAPPPPGVSVDDVVGGDIDQLWRWHDALDLPPPKGWWRNWRDTLRPALDPISQSTEARGDHR